MERGSPPSLGLHGMPSYPLSRCPVALTLVEEGGEISSLDHHPGRSGGFGGAGTAQGTLDGIRAVEQLRGIARNYDW